MIQFNYKREMELLRMIFANEIQADEKGRLYRNYGSGFVPIRLRGKREDYKYITFDKKSMPAHRLVWMCFHRSLIPINMVINHINGNREDCSINNLECITQSENVSHGHKLRGGTKTISL